jgi:hypothetical protein
MQSTAILAIFGAVGLAGIAFTYPPIQKLPTEWRWILGPIVLMIYEISKYLVLQDADSIHGLYAILGFCIGAAIASVVISIRKKRNGNGA